MNEDEFFEFWTALGGDKRKNIGNAIELENKVSRKVLGRNGKGRLGLFGFSEQYKVTTWKNNEKFIFTVKKSKEKGEYAEIILESNESYEDESSGTLIECPIYGNYMGLGDLESAISTRFGADPHFKVYINNNEIKLLDLANYDKHDRTFDGNPLTIVQIPRERYNKRLSQYQVAWWVDQRCAEVNTWKQLGIPLSGKDSLENKYVFCIIADFLENHVKTDWTGFEDTETVQKVKKFVKDEISSIAKDFLQHSHRNKKIKVVKKSKENLKALNPVNQREIGEFIDVVLDQCSVGIEDLSKIVSILATMEKSTRKHELLEKLDEMDPDDMDKMVEILDKWSVEDAYTVLDELYWRLELIAKLEELVDDINTDELHQLQPLFEQGLWMFGPEYEGSTNFTSNKSLRRALREVLGVETKFEGSNKRPDFVATPEGDIWDIYGSDKLKKSKVIGYRKVLILELKKGASVITDEEIDQAKFYVKKIRTHGKLQKDTEIECYVLGSKVNPEDDEELTFGKSVIYPFTYDTIIRNAKIRTLDLKEKIKDVKGITDIGDPEIKEVLKEEQAQETFAS